MICVFFVCLGSIELKEMIEIVGTLYEMEGVSGVRCVGFTFPIIMSIFLEYCF